MSLNDLAGSVSRPGNTSQQQDDEDDDNLSITSTNPDDNDSDKEWEVDDILAERPHPSIPNVSQYLIKWDGFQLEDCTWEPVENLGDGLLTKWEENKADINAGNREVFDLAAYDAACAERTERHLRRNAKRQRLGLPLTPPILLEYTSDTPVASPLEDLFTSDDEAQEVEDEVDPGSIPSSKSKATASTPTLPSTSATATPKATSTTQRVAKQNTFVGIPSTAPPKGSSISRVSEKNRVQKLPQPPTKTNLKASVSGSSSATTSGPIRKGSGGTMTGYQGTAGRSSIFRSNTAKTSTQGASTATNKLSSNTSGLSALSSTPSNSSKAKRLTATRTRQLPISSAATNVFAGGKQRKKRANLGDVMADPSKAPKAFSNMRLMNLAKKRGIEKGDAVGSLSSIPSKFIISNEQTNTLPRKPSLVSPTTMGSPQNYEALNQPSAPSATVSTPQASAGPPQQGGTADMPALKRKKSVRFTEEDNEDFTSMNDDLFDNPVDTNTSTKTPDPNKGPLPPSRKLSLATYQERGQTQTLQKLVKFGGGEAVMVGFTGITRHTAAWLSYLKAEKTLHFASICSSFHFISQRQQLIKEKLSSGAVEAALPEHAVALKNVASALQRGLIGLHLVSREYSILVYPAKCDGWNGLEFDCKKPDEDALLRYLIFRGDVPSQAYPSEFHKEPRAPNQLTYPKDGSDPDLVGMLTGLDFTKLLPQALKLKDKQIYMLLFPIKAQQLLGVFMAWLRSHQPGQPIFTVEQPNGWRLFHEAVQAGSGGTIISHADFTLLKLQKIPYLWQMLEGNKYTFWHLDTGESKRPQYPSDLDAISVPGSLRLTRLFSYGRAFLITPSFAISEPAKLYGFLKWFRAYAANPDHIIVTCYNFPQFLRNITEEKQREQDTLTQRNPGNKDVPLFLERAGRSQQDINDHIRASQLLHEIMGVFGDEETKIRKIHWLHECIDPSDEQSLTNAFCWWARLKCDRFRRFYVLGSDPTKSQGAYRYIDIPRYLDSECSNPDTANILTQRQLLAEELQKEADQYGTEVNISWNTSGPAAESSGVVRKWRKSICKTWFVPPSSLFRSDDAHELERWIEEHRRSTKINWSELHPRPISWKDGNMAEQFGDGDGHGSRFDTFSGWFKAAPKFTSKRNTWYGLFYTITDTWDEYMPKRNYERHPWIAIYRPKNPHLLSKRPDFNAIELFIWDIATTDRGKLGHCFLDMQCQLIDYVYSSVAEKYPGCSLSDVWYSSSTSLEIGPNDNLLDTTCRRMGEMFSNGRDELPPYDNIVRSRWTPVNRQLWSSGMSPMTLRTKPEEKPSELAPKKIPQTEEDKLKPPRAIWHPVGGTTGRHGTKCLNNLYEACLKARLEDPKCDQIKYQYRPTEKWWADQVEEGRGCGYIDVAAAGKIIDKLPKPD
ncbi:hypothetical protein GQX73_g8510 [Xylaria multiplex]|uniref:Chromo domain-containing protein n=1 Tax=Xylaria multiplex TaxID=323545 RepID=A0A7C8MMS5_9PEZI|nr:hypothetical protein GQX73_g8510 [Xylaria multiplex]